MAYTTIINSELVGSVCEDRPPLLGLGAAHILESRPIHIHAYCTRGVKVSSCITFLISKNLELIERLIEDNVLIFR